MSNQNQVSLQLLFTGPGDSRLRTPYIANARGECIATARSAEQRDVELIRSGERAQQLALLVSSTNYCLGAPDELLQDGTLLDKIAALSDALRQRDSEREQKHALIGILQRVRGEIIEAGAALKNGGESADIAAMLGESQENLELAITNAGGAI